MKEKVLIVYGGKSVEHDISIITAMQTLRFVPKECDFLPIYIDRNGIWWTAENLQDISIYKNFTKRAKNKKQVSLLLGDKVLLQEKHGKFIPVCNVLSILNCCHGNVGEDGKLQGVFESCGLAHTSCDTKISAVCMDKVILKDILEQNGIKTPEYMWFQQDCELSNIKSKVKKLGYPVVVKPANLGSSIGVSVCKNEGDLDAALETAFEFDKKVLIEKMIQPLREFNCAGFLYKDNVFVSRVNEVENDGMLYTFENKYIQKTPQVKKVKITLERQIKNLTAKVYKMLGCAGIVRVDFLFDDKDKILYVNEINTIPGSLAFYLFENIKFTELIRCLIEQSLEEKKKKDKFVTSFDSDALNIFENTKFVVKK